MDQVENQDETKEKLLDEENETHQQIEYNQRQDTIKTKPQIDKVNLLYPIENKRVRKVKSVHLFFLYLIFEISISLSKHYFLAKRIDKMHEDKMANFDGFFRIYVYILFIEIIIRAIAISFHMMMILQFLFAIPQLVFYMISYYKISNYLSGHCKYQSVVATITLLVIISLFFHYIVINKLDITAEIIYFVWHLEYIQIITILITYSQDTGQSFDWFYKICYEYFEYYSMCLVIVIYLVLLFITLLCLLINSMQTTYFLLGHNIAVCLIFYFGANAYFNSKIFAHFQSLENQGVFRPNNFIFPSERFFEDFKLYQNYCVINLILVIFHALISIALFNKIKKKYFITEEIFKKSINLDIKKYNNFFKSQGKIQQDQSMQDGDEEDSCFICWDRINEIYLKPCGHTGMCKQCFLDQAKSRQNCPICRQEIKRAYIIEYDEDSKKYKANTRIKLAQ